MDLIKDWSPFLKTWPSNQNERVFGMFTVVSYVPLLVLQWLFHNKLGFGDFGGFSKLRDQGAYLWPFDLERNVANLW